MPQADNPLAPIEEKVTRIEATLWAYARTIFAKIKPMTSLLARILTPIRRTAKEVGAKIGKAAVDGFIKSADHIMRMGPYTQQLLLAGVKIARKLMALIRKAADPKKAFKVIKAMVARLAKLARTITANMVDLMNTLRPVETVLSLVRSMKTVLQFLLDWVGHAVTVPSLVKKTNAMVKKAAKALPPQANQVNTLVKEANPPKPA